MATPKAIKLVATGSPSKQLAFNNFVYVHPDTFQYLSQDAACAKVPFQAPEGSVYCEIKAMVFNLVADSRVGPGDIAFNKTQRMSAKVGLQDVVIVEVWVPESAASVTAHLIECELATVVRQQSALVKEEELDKAMHRAFDGHVLSIGQTATVYNPMDEVLLSFNVRGIRALQLTSAKSTQVPPLAVQRGMVLSSTEFGFTVAEGFNNVTLSSSKTQHKNLFRPDFDFQQLGIGGLDKEFADIFRRAFASRIFPPHIIRELGIQHVRGMLLYGPPGTGKTLIARQIGTALRAREPKIVNGPEILNKYVGQSEENIRALFKDAEDEAKKNGDNSALHIIIFDEIDAICKQRGSSPSGAGVNDSIVNQLLSKIDGVDSLNNILLIGMTNRLDMIDEALLRPGRLEVHMEIGLPDAEGRQQILKIHTEKMRQRNRLAPDVSLAELAQRTKNFSGAEIAGLIRSAASYAFTRKVDVKDLSKPTEVDSIQVCKADFDNALEEVKPAFGAQDDAFDACLVNGIIEYSTDFRKLQNSLKTFAQQVQDSPKTPLLSCLLVGRPGTGKTALAAHIAKVSAFPFAKLVSPDAFVGFSEPAKVSAIKTVFEDAYKSHISLVVLDGLERLVDYTAYGNRFSNIVLQALLVLVKRIPKKEGHRLFVIATSSEPTFMEESGLGQAFNVVLKAPLLTATSNIKTVLQTASRARGNFPDEEIDQVCRNLHHPLPIKHLLMVYEMASEACRSEPHIQWDVFLDCLQNCAL